MTDTDSSCDTLPIEQALNLEPPIYQVGSIEFSPTSGVVRLQGELLLLRAREANLLKALIDAFPGVLSRADIESRLWTNSYATNATINQTVKALRFSLKDESRSLIRTIPKQGYVLSRVPVTLPLASAVSNTTPSARTSKIPPIWSTIFAKKHSKLWLAVVCFSSLSAFSIGYWQTKPLKLERISHKHNGDWYLTQDLRNTTIQRITSDTNATQYVVKTERGIRVCAIENQEMQCEQFE